MKLLCLSMLVVFRAWGLVPIDGFLRGGVNPDIQQDPLRHVFETLPSGQIQDRARHKLYRTRFEASQELERSCRFLGTADYASAQHEALARRSVVANLQYLGLDLTVKAVGAYARALEVSSEDYQRLVNNLTAGSCGPNLSVYGLRLIKSNLFSAYYDKPAELPQWPGDPFAPASLREASQSRSARENEFHHTLKAFRALCSWGGDTRDYRLLVPYLKSPLVMSSVLRHMEGLRPAYDDVTRSAGWSEDPAAMRVACQDLVCRPVNSERFNARFPRVLGSSGLATDLRRLWCGHFRELDYDTKGDHPQVSAWIKAQDPEDDRNEVAQLFALTTGVPDLVVPAAAYSELAANLKRGIDMRWGRWAETALAGFSKDLMFEEALEIRVRAPATAAGAPARFGFDLQVTMGELDRVLTEKDKLSMDMGITVSRGWLQWVKRRWSEVARNADPQQREQVVEEVALQLKAHLAEKKKYFRTPLFGDGLEYLLAPEIIGQLERDTGRALEGPSEKMLELPLRFNYGIFALSYVRYRALLGARGTTLDI
jgi:hypothetical protein